VSYELVFTSASQGLRRGASGFCTVAATEGIPRALQDKLESLSGYRHTEAAHGRGRPVNHSHLTIRIQRSIYHVVSRIGDPGMDYSGRSNKIAHHLALSSAELERFPQGPSPLFSDDSFWHDSWDSAPEVLEPGRLPRSSAERLNGFETWEDVFGDAGWAGLMGHSIADGMKSVSVIVPDSEQTLTLLNEALQLVPLQDRWKVCFSTYYSRHVSGMQCHWRFVLDGTSEARKLRARVQGLLIDPAGSSVSLPEGNAFVEAARAGRPEAAFAPKRPRRVSTASQPESPPATRRPPPAARAVDDDDEEEQHTPQFGQPRRRSAQRQQKPKPVARSPFDIPEEEFTDKHERDEDQSRNRKRGSAKKRRTRLMMVGGLMLAILLILLFLAINR
jgi:hypothetical protein